MDRVSVHVAVSVNILLYLNKAISKTSPNPNDKKYSTFSLSKKLCCVLPGSVLHASLHWGNQSQCGHCVANKGLICTDSQVLGVSQARKDMFIFIKQLSDGRVIIHKPHNYRISKQLSSCWNIDTRTVILTCPNGK